MKVNGQWVPCVCNSSYSFMPIHLKLYMCHGHGLKICMWFGYNPWIIFYHFFSQFDLSHFFGHFSEWIEGTLFELSHFFWTFLHLESDLPVGGIVFQTHFLVYNNSGCLRGPDIKRFCDFLVRDFVEFINTANPDKTEPVNHIDFLIYMTF